MFKALKHKTLEDTFGKLIGASNRSEIFQTSIPSLQPITANIEDMKYLLYGSLAHKQLDDYELVEIEIKIKQ